MPDIASLGIELNSKQVVEGTRALDGLATAATAVEPKVNQVTKAADDLAGASAKVWRYGTDAAKSVEALGEATQRTGQRTQASNGQMNDTAKIMQFQAEQAKAAAAANVALGAASSQASIGAQIFIDKLKEQVAVLGMSRSQLAAYQAAQLGVSREAEASIAKLKAYEDAIKSAADAKAAAAKQSNILVEGVKMLAAAYAALKVGEYIKDAALMAARYETLGVVVEVVGRNAGYTKTQMDTATDAIARQGITMIESRESATKLVQAHVDLKNATVLARIAQDAAVIGHLNSSDAFDRLVNGISRGNVLILRNIGINVNLQAAYQDMAKELGKTAKELTENERVQARLNAVIERGADIAGTYTAAMDTAGKQITSMQRYTQDLKTKIGEVFNESLTVGVMALTSGLKDANGEVSELSRNNQLHEWGHSLTTVFVGVANAIDNVLTGAKLAGTWAAHFNAGNDIDAKFYDRQRTTPADKMPALRKEWAQALADEQRMYEESQTTLGATFDRFQRAHEERSAAQLEKRKKEADAKLKVDQDYAKAATALMIANANKSVEIQQKAQLALANSVYVGTPNYRDSEGREPKPKVDRAENTALASKIQGFERDAKATKDHYEALGRLDAMYLKAGELSAQQAYENKRAYALATYEAQIDAFDRELDALGSHNSKTNAEDETHKKKSQEIIDRRDAAEKAFFADSRYRDEEERLRKAANATAASDAANKEVASINAQVAAIEMQIRTYGMLPAAKTAVQIADLEEQNAALAGMKIGEDTIAQNNRKIEALGRLKVAQAAAYTQEQGTDVTKAKELLDILTAVDTAAREAAAGMAASFGTVGQAIGGLTTALTGYSKTQAAVAAQLAAATKDAGGDTTKIAKANAAAQQQNAQAQMKSYGDMAGAAKGFFKENTAGYRALEGAEKAYRAVEMAMAVQAMVKKLFAVEAVTAATVTGEAVKSTAVVAGTATQVAADGVKGASAAAVAVATQAQGDPYTAWGRMAAMVAVMAALGFAVAGGGGGGDTTAKDRQAKQGTGSVLGDESAKSESISRSIENLEKYASIELSHTRDMLSALVKIRDTIGVVAAMATQTAGLRATALDEKKYGVGSSSGFLGIGASSTSIQDSGIKLNGSQTIGSAILSGVDASGYADITKKNSGLWGLFSSSKTSRDTIALDDDLKKQFGLLVGSMRDGAIEAVKLLGVSTDGILEKINGMALGIDEISFKGMTGAEIEKELEAVFSKVGDDIAKLAVPELAQFQQVGEGYLETLTRVATNYATLDSILASSGVTFGAVGLSSIAARENFIKLAGGLDAFMEGTQSFNDNFLTEAEQLAPVQKYVTEQLAAMGLQGIDTRDKFKETVLGLANSGALATEAGAKQYTGLLALADAFAKTHEATEDLTLSQKEIADQRKDLQDQYDELTMTSTQLRAKEALTIAASNKPLWDKVQAELAAKAAVEETSTILGLQAQMYEANGDKAAAALVVEQQRAIALADLTPAVVAATQATWAAQDAEKARKDALTINNGILANDLAYYQAIGDTAGVAATAQKQWLATLAAMDPALRESATRAHDAQAAATESNAILSAQASMYEAAGDKAGAAAVLQAQHTAALVGMTPALAAATQAMWDAQAAAKAKADALTISNGILANEASYYEAVNDKAGAARIAQQQWLATLAAMDPALRESATKAHDAQLQQKATADAVAESNTILGLQAQMYDAANDKAGAAVVLEKQRTAALVGLTPAVIAATKATWAAQDAEKARAEALTESNGILAAQASMYEASGDKAGAARVLELQRIAALKEMTPLLATATQAMWDAQDAEKARSKALAESSAILDAQLQMYEASGDKANAAVVRSLQRSAQLIELYDKSPALAEATWELWHAQDAAKAAAEQLSNSEAILAILGSTYEASGNKAGALHIVEQQRLISLSKLTPELRELTLAQWAAQDAAAAQAAALAEANTILGIQAQIADATGDAVLAATVLEKQRTAALAELSPAVAAVTRELWAATDAAKAAAQAAELAGQKRALDIQLMEALGDAAGALAAKRADELAAMDASLRGTQQLIYAAEDAVAAQTAAKAATDAALQAVQRAVDAERTRIGVIRDAAAESVESIKSVFDVLKSAVTELYGTVSSTSIMQASQGNAFIDNALATVLSSGYLPDSKELADAIAAARGGLDASQFATQFEADRAALVMAGKLSQLQVASGTQLSVAERSLKTAEEQLKALDAQLAAAQQQVDLLRGVNTGVLSVVAAIAALTAAVGRESAGAVPTAPSTPVPTAPNVPIKGWDGGMMPPTDVLNGVANLPGTPDTSALSKAQQDYFNLLSVTPGQGSGQELMDYVKALQDVQALSSMESIMGIKNDPHESADAFMVRHGYKLDALATDPKQRYSFAVGTNFVPYDMVAQIHEGEAIIPRAFNPAAGGAGWGSTARLERLVEGLTAEVQRLQGVVAEGNKNTAKVADSTGQLADQFDDVTEGGNGIRSSIIDSVVLETKEVTP